MKTYVAPSMTASEFDNHDIVSCVPCLIRVFGGGREYYHDEGGAPLPDLFYVEYHGTAGNPVPSGMRFMHWWQICLYQRLPRFDM